MYIDTRGQYVYLCTRVSTRSWGLVCQGVRVERAQRVQDNLMGNNHDTHRAAHTPPWPRSDCRNAGLYFLRMRTIDWQLRAELLARLPLRRFLASSLLFRFPLPSSHYFSNDTADWERSGTERSVT